MYKVTCGEGEQVQELANLGRDAAYIIACAWHCERRPEVRVETPSGKVWPYQQFKLFVRDASRLAALAEWREVAS
jgi:hypothetical protein